MNEKHKQLQELHRFKYIPTRLSIRWRKETRNAFAILVIKIAVFIVLKQFSFNQNKQNDILN